MNDVTAPVHPPAERTTRRRARRLRAALLALALSCAALALVPFAIRRIPGFGPWMADRLRAIIGSRAVTELEELGASLEDRWKRLRRSGKPPRSLRELEVTVPSNETPPPVEPERLAPSFRPRDVGPLIPKPAAPEDGTWRPIPDPVWPGAPPLLFATLLHPDPKRPWAEVFVVAIDLPRIRVHAVAGTVDPIAETAEGRRYRRSGLIPQERQPRLLAAFNGGFKTQHGHHGMLVDGTTLVPPQPNLCTLVGYRDGTLAVAAWRKIDRRDELDFLRQTPGCMVEAGALHPLLRQDDVRNWGATLEGKTVIRRSAVGLDTERNVLYVAVSNDTTARAIAEAVRHAGASDVAQLDVNWSFPKFLLFPPAASGERRAQTLFRGFVFEADEYLRKPSRRDFFYLVRR